MILRSAVSVALQQNRLPVSRIADPGKRAGFVAFKAASSRRLVFILIRLLLLLGQTPP
jgi:hypothetical protein